MTSEAAFEAERRRVTRLAYRMLGSLADAQDVVQDAWPRWAAAGEAADIDNPGAWLTRCVTRLCIDRLRAAKARRETYVGPWLPEPLIEPPSEDALEGAEDVSVAFLLALQRLSPLERAVFLLREVFDETYATIAETLGRDEAACRQLQARAKAHMRKGAPRFTVAPAHAARLVAAFADAASRGDTKALATLLAEDCVLITDGGGKRSAALRPIVGRSEILALLAGLRWRHGGTWAGRFEPARINGWPGLIITADEGVQTVAFEPGPDDRLRAIYVVRNPEKLAALAVAG